MPDEPTELTPEQKEEIIRYSATRMALQLISALPGDKPMTSLRALCSAVAILAHTFEGREGIERPDPELGLTWQAACHSFIDIAYDQLLDQAAGDEEAEA